MKFKDLTAAISEQEDVPLETVRKISRALLKSISNAVDSGQKLTLPGMVLRPHKTVAREATADEPARPEIKSARLRLKKGK